MAWQAPGGLGAFDAIDRPTAKMNKANAIDQLCSAGGISS
jgi:hypothetical protein